MRILHLTDLHLAKPGELQYGLVDTAQVLGRLLDDVPADWDPQVVVVSGDISNDDSEYSYHLALDLVGGWAAQRGLQTLWVPGNHDQASGVELLHRPDAGHQLRGVVEIDDAAFALLDTRSPGYGYGTMPNIDAELAELADFAGERIVVMHHPALPAPTALHHALRLRGHGPWTQGISNAGISTVLSGHYHLPLRGFWGAAEVIVGAAVANLTITDDWRREAAVAMHGLQFVETRAGESARVRTIWHGDRQAKVFEMTPDQVIAVCSQAGNPAEAAGGVALPVS